MTKAPIGSSRDSTAVARGTESMVGHLREAVTGAAGEASDSLTTTSENLPVGASNLKASSELSASSLPEQ